ncbi:Grip84, partial [Drosophila busckii]
SRAPHTSESILREFRATVGNRLSNRKLLLLLQSISHKRPNHREVLKEISHTLERKDPMYALLLFVELINDTSLKPLGANSSASLSNEMPMPTLRCQAGGQDTMSAPNTVSLADELQTEATSLNLSTSTPLTSRKLDLSSGLSTLGATSEMSLDPQTINSSSSLDEVQSSTLVNSNSNSSINSNNNSNRTLRAVRTVSSTTLANMQTPALPNIFLQDTLPDVYRTNSLWNFYKVEALPVTRKQEIAALPLSQQERAVMHDMIYCLIGMRGNYIVPEPRDPNAIGKARYETRFSVHLQPDNSLVDMVNEILPLASHFMGVQKISAETEDWGQINNALNAALFDLSSDFYVCIQIINICIVLLIYKYFALQQLMHRLEQELLNDQLSMAKLLYYLQPTIWMLEELFNTLVQVPLHNYRGAALLSHLCERIKELEGDKSSQTMIITLTCSAAVPYMQMLQLWIQKGATDDKYQQFLVEDNEVKHRGELPEHYSDDYWEKRYTVRTDCIPSFLDKNADKIIRTGKYLNVIRQCGKRVMPIQQMDLKFDPTNDKHIYVINDAYYFSARMLLDVLLTENDLMGHLQSVKRYLLLNQGDFTMQFMDACEEELSKNVDQVLPMTLENLLGLTLRLSSARSDPYKDDLHCDLLTYDLVTQMSKIMDKKEEYWQTTKRLNLSGLECFAFTYEVKWPVSLVLNHIAISKYQMLFRQLFYCKHVERQLCKIWKENSVAKKFTSQAAKLYRSAFTLRQRMMNAVQNLEYYMMIEVIEPNWHEFIEKMKKVENVDMVLTLHQDFLDLCLKNCMLTEASHLNRAIFKLCKICLKFCEFIQRSQRFFIDAELKSMVSESNDDNTDQSDSEADCSERSQSATTPETTSTFAETVTRFDLQFTGVLISFLKQINEVAKENTADRFMNLVHRINFNGFYTEQMEKMCAEKAMG